LSSVRILYPYTFTSNGHAFTRGVEHLPLRIKGLKLTMISSLALQTVRMSRHGVAT